MKKIAFLDRDGTINKEYPDEMWKYIDTPKLLDNTIQGLKIIKDLLGSIPFSLFKISSQIFKFIVDIFV